MLDYRLLAALAAVVETGSFERAAAALYLTQSAVSQRVKQLEERLGQILLIRATPPEPTSAGRTLLKHYRQVRLLEDELPTALIPQEEDDAGSMALGVNADSLATWFWPAVFPLLEDRRLLLELRVEDQDATHQLLKDGEVVGCISAREKPTQGCRAVYLGTMVYRLCATPSFARRWFPDGLSLPSVEQAPAAIFSRQDSLQHRLLTRNIGVCPEQLPAHYVPSHEAFNQLIIAGHAYGSMLEQQARPLIEAGALVDLSPDYGEAVRLYWHCWNLKSSLLEALESCLCEGAQTALIRN